MALEKGLANLGFIILGGFLIVGGECSIYKIAGGRSGSFESRSQTKYL